MDQAGEALLALGRALTAEGYRFVTPTPETHRRVIARRGQARDVRDVFGWSLPFAPDLLPREWVELLRRAGALAEQGEELRSLVRYASLEHGLFVHSAFPTTAPDSVFFGPDTYRFCAWLGRSAGRARRVVDIGCGSGAGGLVAAKAAQASELVLVDVNPRALALSEVNVALSAHPPRVVIQQSDVLSTVHGELDLIVANPPYMRDAGDRLYRDGGGSHGEALSLRIAREALARLAPAGTLLLYTGAAVVDGRDVFFDAVRPIIDEWPYRYEELDPDVFGEELERPGYEAVERIAAVGLRVRRPL